METYISNAPRLTFFRRGKTFRVSAEEIIRLESRSNYTWIFFTSQPPVLSAKVLRTYDKLLHAHGFMRTHRSHLVNLQYVDGVDKNGEIRMQDDSHAEISRSKKSEVYRMIKCAS